MIIIVYLDNASTTFVDPEAIDIITKSLQEEYLNPSALYAQSESISNLIQDCKNKILDNLDISKQKGKHHIYFTSGGCEGNNWVIKGCVAEYYRYYNNEGLIHNFSQNIKKPHIITSSFEHHSVLNACKQLEALRLAKVTYLKPNEHGIIDPQDILKHISHVEDDYQTILVSIMWVNNVLGSIQPIKEIGDICKHSMVKFHTDAVQAVGNIHINLSEYNIDFMTVSGHKFHAPKGIGFVYIKDNKYIQPMISGGGQEYGMRAGTENVPYIKALTYCLEKYNNGYAIFDKQLKIQTLKNELGCRLFNIENSLIFHSSYEIGTINIAFKDLISDLLVYNLGERGYLVSVGSACDNGNFEDSHVLTSVDYSKDYINGNIRITLSEFNTIDEVIKFAEVLKEEVIKLRGY